MISALFVGDSLTFKMHYPELVARMLINDKHLLEDRCMVVYSMVDIPVEQMLVLEEIIEKSTIGVAEKIVVVVGAGRSVYLYDKREMQHQNHEFSDPRSIERSIVYWVDAYAQLYVLYNQQPRQFSMSYQERMRIRYYGGEHSSMTMYMLMAGVQQSAICLDLYVQGEYAQVRVRGAYLLRDDQTVDISIYQHHGVPRGASEVLIKGIVKDKAFARYNGLIYIATTAPFTDAVQENKNIVLGGTARVDSIPRLEVLNNEVRCAHGSAVGHVDSEQLFYMQSRGLAHKKATQLLVYGFVVGVFDGFAGGLVDEYIQQQCV